VTLTSRFLHGVSESAEGTINVEDRDIKTRLNARGKGLGGEQAERENKRSCTRSFFLSFFLSFFFGW